MMLGSGTDILISVTFPTILFNPAHMPNARSNCGYIGEAR